MPAILSLLAFVLANLAVGPLYVAQVVPAGLMELLSVALPILSCLIMAHFIALLSDVRVWHYFGGGLLVVLSAYSFVIPQVLFLNLSVCAVVLAAAINFPKTVPLKKLVLTIAMMVVCAFAIAVCFLPIPTALPELGRSGVSSKIFLLVAAQIVAYVLVASRLTWNTAERGRGVCN